ncbi:MAG: fused MFS/spermidine synthase [Bacteroidia bacterium]|nr:fused MFS/spermidine synthase [Bacteroidia bacterium]
MAKPMITTLSYKQLYLVSFIEGGVVMVTEIAGAKMLTPYFGASLYSWASTLSITLLALMSGYYYGGYATTKPWYNSADKILWVFLISGLSVAIMPMLGSFIMLKTIAFSFFTGLIVSQLLFLFIPIFLMGMISPMIIFQVTKKAELSGRSAGNIYAISTSGGILFTMCFGFLIIPGYGISLPVRVLGIAVTALAFILLIRNKMIRNKITVAFILLVLAILSLNHYKPRDFPPGSKMRLVDYSEGLLGELRVVDQLTQKPDGGFVNVRKLRVNNIQQNYVFTDVPSQSLLFYVNFAKQLFRFIPKKENVLLIGLGAGSLYGVLNKEHSKIETVEIDQRIYDFGIKYFGMPDHSNHHITDGRYFINTTKKKYDLIIIDVIIGESVPGQLLTLESLKKCGELLNPGGSLLIESGGLENFSENAFIPSVYKTLQSAGFLVKMYNPLRKPNFGDIVFLASKAPLISDSTLIADDVLIKGGPLSEFSMSLQSFNTKSSRVLTDDLNYVDVMLKDHYFRVRQSTRKEIASLNASHQY